MEVVVDYEYSAQETDELNLRVGDVITDVIRIQEGWCEGILNGVKGVFPDNFVKEIKKEKQGDLPQKRNISGINQEIKSKLANIIINPPPFSVPKKAFKKAKVTYAYCPQNDDELTLEVGQIIDILKQEEPGWWEGNLNGHVGMFPSNFVELIEKDTEPAEVPEIKGRKIVGVGLGPNIFESGQITLRPINPVSPPREKPILVPHTKMIPVKKSPNFEKNKPVRAKVVYEYKAENPDELHLNIGDIIVVLDQNLEDVGWWKGDLNGKIGVFPDNFVEVLPEEKTQKHSSSDIDTKPKIGVQALEPLVPLSKPKLEDDQKNLVGSDLVKGMPRRPPIPGNILQKSIIIPKKEEIASKPLLKENRDLNSIHAPIKFGSAVTLEMFTNLQNEVENLKEQLDKMKKDHEKTLLQLMSEIDEEKKNRFNIQVEIDRIKKLIKSSSAS